ncbi:hypothetical protein [Pelagibius sp.]|uniref:hypothetical protein n=1 Tax=Pelagibius sp. TaxID=1931238 RepID=UPI00262AB688|nr:hypothetical protein [Pelagibius sp.]
MIRSLGVRWRAAWSLWLAAVLVSGSMSPGPALAGDLPKAGSFSATFVNEGRTEAVQIGKDEWSWTFFGRIATVNESGAGPWHNMSGDCLGMGIGEQSSGYCRLSDADGDMIFEHWTESVAGKGTSKVSGGTGKFEGIEATFEYDYVLLPSSEGRVHLVGKKRGRYTLP